MGDLGHISKCLKNVTEYEPSHLPHQFAAEINSKVDRASLRRSRSADHPLHCVLDYVDADQSMVDYHTANHRR